MKTRHIMVLFAFWIGFAAHLQAQELDLYTCLDSAERHMPLLRQRSMMDEVLRNKLENYDKANLPGITANGQLTYQSVVPELPFSIPGAPGLDLPRVQYRTYVEVYQPLFSAGRTRARKISESAQTEVSIKTLDVSMSEYKKQVAQIYFQLLLVGDQSKIISKSLDLMKEREKAVESAVELGVAQQNDILKLQSEILKLEKRLDELASANDSGLEILSLLTGISTQNRNLLLPGSEDAVDDSIESNPQIEWINTRQGGLLANEDFIKSQRLPYVSAFGQMGVGAPNPYNFFEKDLNAYFMVGIRARWTIWDWGKSSNERTILQLNHHMLEEQKNQKKIELQSNVTRIRNERQKVRKALDRDGQIKSIRTQIRVNAGVQLDLGMITYTEYLDELLAEQVAELQLSVDEIALLQYQILLQFETGALQ